MAPFAVFGIGLMIMVAPLTAALMRSIPVRHSGVASAFNNAVSRVGPQLAGALLFIAITSSFYASLQQQLPEADPSALREHVSPLNPVAGNVDEAVATAARGASTEAFHLAALTSAGLCFAGALVNAIGIRNPDRSSVHEQEPRRASLTRCHESPPLETGAPHGA